MRLAFFAADISVFAFVANKLARHKAKSTVGAWIRLTRCVRYIHGHSRWIHEETKYSDLTFTPPATDTRPRPPERIMRSDDGGHALSARTSCNTNSTSILIQ